MTVLHVSKARKVVRMVGVRQIVWLLLPALAAATGCAGAMLARDALLTADEPPSAAAPSAAAAPPTTAAPAASLASNVPPAANSDSPGNPQALVDVLNQLQSLRDMDPAAYEQLKSDLNRTDPKLWAPMVQSFRAALAYRQRAQSSPASNLSPAFVQSPAQPTMVALASVPSLPAQPPAIAQQANTTASLAPLSGVQPVAHIATSAEVAWQQQLSAAVRSLERELSQSPNLSTGDRRQVYLRMLHLIAGQRDAALQPIPGLEPAEQEFWSQELFGLSKYLDIPTQPDRSRRAAEAGRYLGEALPKLSQLAALGVRNIAFCSEVSSYGVLTRFDKDEFRPGQQVLLYAEVENFLTEATPKGHHTALSSSYQIFDSRGQRVAEHEFPLTEEFCLNPRRDFFIRYFLRMPEQMYDGPHTLQLTIEDTLGHKVAQAKIEFQIKRKP